MCDRINLIKANYFDSDGVIQELKPLHQNELPMFSLNIRSLSRSFLTLKYLCAQLNFEFKSFALLKPGVNQIQITPICISIVLTKLRNELELLDLTYFELARTSLTRIFLIPLSFIVFFSSSINKPVSFFNWSTYVIAGLPLSLVPCFGPYISSWHTSSSFLLHICPIDINLLALSTAVILLSYSTIISCVS